MMDTTFCVPLLWIEMFPVICVLVQELGLRVIHAIKAHAVKVSLDLGDRICDHKVPVSSTVHAELVRFRQTEVFFEGLKVLTDFVDRFAALLVDGPSISIRKCLEVLEDGLLLATAFGFQHIIHRIPEPSS